VRRAFLVRGLAAFAGDAALGGFVHGGKAPLGAALGFDVFIAGITGHMSSLMVWRPCVEVAGSARCPA
jgi:hypothetical protein